MQISVATANYYQLPFEQALDIIAQAGFQTVELDLFWERKNWAMAQHLRGCAPRDVVRWIHQAGLKVSSIHDGGGVLDGPGFAPRVHQSAAAGISGPARVRAGLPGLPHPAPGRQLG